MQQKSKLFTFFLLSFLLSTSFSCNKDTITEKEISHEKSDVQSSNERSILACPVPTFNVPAINSGKLYNARLAVAEYRLWQKVKGLSSFSATTLSGAGLPASLANATFALKMQKAIAVSISGSTTFDRAYKFRRALHSATGATLTSTEISILYNYSNSSWDGPSTTVGSYSILFTNGWDYSGKGAFERAKGSCGENCTGGHKLNVQFWNSMDQPATSADHQPAANYASNTDRQAYKEESIRIYEFGGPRNTPRANTYNEIQQSGVGYINTDGF